MALDRAGDVQLKLVGTAVLPDGGIDFLTTIFASLRAFHRYRAGMLVWSGMIAGLLLIAMLPEFLGLLVILPVLGHAIWHLYRRAAHECGQAGQRSRQRR